MEIEAYIKTLIGEIGRCLMADVTNDAKLVFDLGFESIDMVDLMNQVELKYNIQLPDDASYRTMTVKQFIELCKERIGNEQ